MSLNKASRNVSKIKKNQDRYSVVIPAAGIGTRMRSYGPKALMRIDGDTTIISRQISQIKKVLPNSEIILITGYEADKLMNSTPPEIIKVENERFEDTNVARSIGLGLRAASTERVLIIYGDLVFNLAAIDHSYEDKSFVVLANGTMREEEVGCVVDDKGNLEHILYELPQKWAQIVYLTGKELKMFQNITWSRQNEKLYGFEVINTIIDKGGRFASVQPPKILVTDIDSSGDIERVKSIIQ